MVTLYGSELSLYSGKARSYLRKQGIDFKEVKSTIGVYKKIIIPKISYWISSNHQKIRYRDTIDTEEILLKMQMMNFKNIIGYMWPLLK